tara:strand:+ start:69225 stop:70625 length:1401 start_codon:yes stop_codon:yes gene_type:complete
MTIRTRFAPSPTGFLHIGGARTALFSWLFARKHGGQFILRIEDTDRERSTEESVQAIFDGMNWLGLDWDEVPVYQTHKFERYAQLIQQLVDEDKAYRCYCSKERLDALREQQMANKEKPRYDGHCRDCSDGDVDAPHVIRFKNPIAGSVAWDDLVRGTIEVQNSELDDLIIQRTDGSPTYNFCVVVDDWDMNMTHVLRGDDHINNTPRQINLYAALGVKPPIFGHLPMILGSDGARLSKRHGAVSVMQYRDEGFLPEALLNYLVRLGWSHGDQELFSKQDMIDLFDVEHINKSPASFNPEKLQWLNQQYLKSEAPDYVAAQLALILKAKGVDAPVDHKLIELVKAQAERSKTLIEMADKSLCFYQTFETYNEAAVEKCFKPESVEPLQLLHDKLAALSVWEQDDIHVALQAVGEELGLKMGKYGPAVRVAVTGSTMSPGLDLTLYLIGQADVLERLQKAIALIKVK